MSNIWLDSTVFRTVEKGSIFGLGKSEKILWITWDLNLEERRGIGGSSILEMCHWWSQDKIVAFPRIAKLRPRFRNKKKNKQHLLSIYSVRHCWWNWGYQNKQGIVPASEDPIFYWGRERCKPYLCFLALIVVSKQKTGQCLYCVVVNMLCLC